MRNGCPRKTFRFADSVLWRDNTGGRSEEEMDCSGSTDRHEAVTELQPEWRTEALATRRNLASRRGRTKRLT
jgi:hypothetical protein